MALKKFLMVAFVAAVLVACGDDSSSATDSDEVSSSSVCEDCDDSSSSKAKSSSSFSVTPQSSERETSVSSSSSAKSSSSEKKTESSSSMTSSLSSSVDSSSSGTGESSSSSGGLSSSSSTESSSSVASCSSGVQSSSSVAYVDPSTVVKGTITDSRDGQTYKTVTIGSQTWMAQNLNYETANSYCYGDSPSNCTKYGRLYTWAAAMDSAGTWSANGKGCGYAKTCTPTYPVRGVCPTGWHLPTKAEFETLFTAVGGSSTAGTKLKSTSGWIDFEGKSGNGVDTYSFSALPAGRRYYNEGYNFEGSLADFWSSTETDSYNAYGMYLDYIDVSAYLLSSSKNYGFSVRCVKD